MQLGPARPILFAASLALALWALGPGICPSLDRGVAHADADPGLRLPPGTHRDASGQQISGRGLRETTDFLAAELARRGIAVQQIGPYAARGVELTRFLSRTPSTSWLAIHVLRATGKTVIFFVPRSKSVTTP